MNRLVAFLTAARRSHAERAGRRSAPSVVPVWNLGSAHLMTIAR